MPDNFQFGEAAMPRPEDEANRFASRIGSKSVGYHVRNAFTLGRKSDARAAAFTSPYDHKFWNRFS